MFAAPTQAGQFTTKFTIPVAWRRSHWHWLSLPVSDYFPVTRDGWISSNISCVCCWFDDARFLVVCVPRTKATIKSQREENQMKFVFLCFIIHLRQTQIIKFWSFKANWCLVNKKGSRMITEKVSESHWLVLWARTTSDTGLNVPRSSWILQLVVWNGPCLPSLTNKAAVLCRSWFSALQRRAQCRPGW